MKRNRLRYSVIIASTIVIIGFLFIFDYSDPLSKPNRGFSLGIIASIFNIIAMILSIKEEKKKTTKTQQPISFNIIT
jgi:hypothetical protein